jgi:hypothetical protein
MILSGCTPKLITVNFTKTGMSKQPKGLIVHIAEAPELGSIFNWFNNPDQRVKDKFGVEQHVTASAHFGIAKDGEVWQFVDTDHQAHAQMGGNPDYFSVEHCGYPGDELTDAQIKALAWLFRYLSDRFGFPLQIADQPGQFGLGYHSMSKDWGHPQCPGRKIIDQRQQVVDIAREAAEQVHRAELNSARMRPSLTSE